MGYLSTQYLLSRHMSTQNLLSRHIHTIATVQTHVCAVIMIQTLCFMATRFPVLEDALIMGFFLLFDIIIFCQNQNRIILVQISFVEPGNASAKEQPDFASLWHNVNIYTCLHLRSILTKLVMSLSKQHKTFLLCWKENITIRYY